MKLLYIHQYFVGPSGAGGTRSYDVAKHLVAMGHEVTLICGWTVQSGLPEMSRWRWWQTHRIDGIKVISCNVAYDNMMRVSARLWSFLSFAVLSTLAGLGERGVDLVFATSTPLTVGIPGRLITMIRRRPYVFEVRDLWPEDLLAAGRIKPGWQYQAWSWLESFSYRTARRILLVSQGFHDRLLERGFAPERLATVVLGADGGIFRDVEPDTEYVEAHGLTGKTIAVYTGAHGDANGLFQLVEAAERLRDRPDIAIVLIGDGKMRPALQQAAADKGLTNIHLLGMVPKKKLPGILAACHIGLMILKQITRPRWVTPNKIFDYMFTGLPSIVNFPGTTAELVEREQIGVASKAGDAADLAARIIHWVDHPDEREAIGRRARKVAWEKYDREMIARRMADIFEACVA
ncbi:MAG: glycosyltransferase family 4 protein [bacterium]|nr:glycosyltransferase family 4 protein [bacterium]